MKKNNLIFQDSDKLPTQVFSDYSYKTKPATTPKPKVIFLVSAMYKSKLLMLMEFFNLAPLLV